MPTTNPVPSTDPSDLLFNAGKLDEVVNGTANSFTDRLGSTRRTVAGMNADFDAQLADAESDLNVYRADAAASAAEALGYLQTIRATSYGAYAEDPATDPLGNPPTEGDEYWNTTAKLLKRWNGTTWQASDINTANFAASSGSSLVGYDGGTVQDVLDGAKSLQDYVALRAYTGRATRIYITGLLVTAKPSGFSGVFQYDATDTTSSDNGGTIIVGADGRRWKRDFDGGTVHVKWFGAVGNEIRNDTAEIQAAINSGYKNIFIDAGRYIVDTLYVNNNYLTIYGPGQGGHDVGGAVLITKSVGTDVFSCRQITKTTFRNFRIQSDGARNNRDGFSLNGCVWTIFDNVHIHQMGRHGIYCTDDGTTGYSGCYPVFINKTHVVGCVGDGVNIISNSATRQMNAIYIHHSEFQSNSGNGATLWGTSVVLRDSLCEGNGKFGVYFDNELTTGLNSATAMVVDGCYFEQNDLGHIGGRVGSLGAILGLTISNNYLLIEPGLASTYVSVKFVANGVSTENSIRGLSYYGNSVRESGTGNPPAIEADFADSLNHSCSIRSTRNPASTSSFDLYAEAARFINLGSAKLDLGLQSKVLSGLLESGGGSGITYSAPEKSNNITVSGSSIYFPLGLPVGTNFDRVQIPVDTDSTGYTVQFQILARTPDGVGSYVNLRSVSKTQTTSGITNVQSGSFRLLGSDNRKTLLTEGDTILKVVVTWTVAPVVFLIGNPTVFYS